VTAEVSKQTVYKQFTDKESLFREIVESVTGNSDGVVAILTEAFGETLAVTRNEFEMRLRIVARVYLDAVLRAQVLSLRRLIIAEAEHFPDLAGRYYEQAPARGIDVIADCIQPYADAGLVITDDVHLAAAHFAYLSLGPAQDRMLFFPAEPPSPEQRERFADAAARAFLAAYGVEKDVHEE